MGSYRHTLQGQHHFLMQKMGALKKHLVLSALKCGLKAQVIAESIHHSYMAVPGL